MKDTDLGRWSTGEPARITNYILDGKTPVAEADTLQWLRWFETADRQVAKTELGDIWVSTVFLGIDHSFGRGHEPVLFETMVFRHSKGFDELDMYRYCTWDEAEAGHARMVEKVKKELEVK